MGRSTCEPNRRLCSLWKLMLLYQSIPDSHAFSGLIGAASRRPGGPLSRTTLVSLSHGDQLYAPTIRRRVQGMVVRRVRKVVSLRRRSTNQDDADLGILKSENSALRKTIRELEEENERLKQRAISNNAKRVVGIEQFEGERFFFGDDMDDSTLSMLGSSNSGSRLKDDNEAVLDDLWCDELSGDECPIEPTISFIEALRDRAYWLVGLLLMQSFSGLILSRNEALLSDHPVIIFFLTMLVGAGGNAGNQASVRVIRGLALGTLNDKTRGQFLTREFKMAIALSGILSIAGFCRAIFFRTAFPEALAVTVALCIIVFSSICLGAILPIVLEWFGIDPAHSSTTIQVIMDILGVILAVTVSRTILDGPFGAFLIAKLGMGM